MVGLSYGVKIQRFYSQFSESAPFRYGHFNVKIKCLIQARQNLGGSFVYVKKYHSGFGHL